MSEFPKTIAEVQKRERSLWDIGDALIAECGLPSEKSGVNDGSLARIKAAAEAIEFLKIEGYSIHTLREMRDMAHRFPKNLRRNDISWASHREARSPDMLETIIKASGKKSIGQRTVRGMKKAINAFQDEKYRKQYPDKNPPPYRDLPIPSIKDVRGLAFTAEVTRWINEVRSCDSSINDIYEKVERNLSKLETVDVDVLVETAITLAEDARKLAELARRLQPNKRGHLYAVGAAE